ncbi:MAG: hypothetical protein J0I98_06920 [Mesorhizobium sp.]|nr:hypothetical protein [Mesorhizobium sp.]MBN9242507.1 hypothetical protein [Mesorhizobium sp.]
MQKMANRLERLERAMQVSNAPITDVRRATDAQLEAFLASLGINPGDEAALIAVAEGRESLK